MRQKTDRLVVATRRGLVEITEEVRRMVREAGVQGLYVWEHRAGGHRREVVVHVLGE